MKLTTSNQAPASLGAVGHRRGRAIGGRTTGSAAMSWGGWASAGPRRRGVAGRCQRAWSWNTRLDAATAAGCRHDGWLPPCRVGLRARARGRRRGCRSALVRSGKGHGAEHSAAARDAALRAAKPPRLRRERHQEGEGWRRGAGGGRMEKRGIRLVVSRPGARRAPAASGSTEDEWI